MKDFFKLRENNRNNLLEQPSTVIVFQAPFQLFDKAGKSFSFNLSKYNVTKVADSNDRHLAIAGEPKDLEKLLKTHPMLKGKVDVAGIMKAKRKFTGKEKFGRGKGKNFSN